MFQIQLTITRKRARYDSGEDLIDPSDMFGGGGMGPGGMGGGIDPEIIFSMMNGGGGFGGAGGFSGGGFGGGRSRAQGFPGGFHFG